MATDAKDKSIRKYQVFISSTFRELKAHREAAVRGIINAGHFPLALENYGPQPNDIETVIRQAIESDQYWTKIAGTKGVFIEDKIRELEEMDTSHYVQKGWKTSQILKWKSLL